jgi:ribosomal protein RSM22 (predicted rRNA methylase)
MLSRNTLPQETSRILELIPSIIEKTFAIPARFRSSLPSGIAELSHLLTNNRSGRTLSYLGQPKFLHAYLNYFLPWNIYRLSVILHNENIILKANDIITDMGSGPLTFVSALWISRPDLRNIPLEINCVDRSSPALDAGKKFFRALCHAINGRENSFWKINLIRKDIDIRHPDVQNKKKSPALVCAINMFNEIYENIPHSHTDTLKQISANAAEFMHSLASKKTFILTVEPGVPQSGKFISLLRTAFLELDRLPASPCPHTKECPCSGKRWCHFAFKTVDAPKELLRLSEAARLQKERLVFSYLLTGSGLQIRNSKEKQPVRVISDIFPLPDNRFGRYGCSSKGLVLLTGSKSCFEKIISGSLINSLINVKNYDTKSGALIIEIK